MNNTSPTRHVDVAIIGSGTAGNSVYGQIKKHTNNIVIINEGFWTTVCATVGCMPSKLLIAAGNRAHKAKHSEQFGIKTDTTVDGTGVMQRVQSERNRFAKFVQQNVDEWNEEHKISGKATITEDGLIAVNNELILADKIVIATGSKPHVTESWQEALGDKLLTSDTVFEMPDLPSSIAVVGAGAIGLELAQAFTRLGVQVRVFNRSDKLGGIQDDKVNEKAIESLSRELDMALSSTVQKMYLDANQRVVIDYLDKDEQPSQFKADYVLVAIGRKSALDNLGVKNLGVELDDKNRPLHINNETSQVADLPVYIVGDANGKMPLLHVASTEAIKAAHHIIETSLVNDKNPTQNNLEKTYKIHTPFSMVFCEPQIAYIGKTLEQIEKAGVQYVVGEVSFDNQGRSRVMGVNSGLLRIYVDKSNDRLLGASMIAPDAEYIAHILAMAVTQNLTTKQLLDTPFYHPTILEGLRTALRDVQEKIKNC